MAIAKKRKHHYVPAFILAGFTLAGDREGRLWVHDRCVSREPWPQTPRNVAHERDFYQVKGPEPLVVEDGLMKLEDLAAPVLRRISETQDLPAGREMDVLLNLVAGMAARVPRRRRQLSKFMSEIARLTLQAATSAPEALATTMAGARAEKPDLPEVTYKEMRNFSRRADLEFDVDRSWLVRRMLEDADLLLRTLFHRGWTLLIAKRDAANFICSDNPITLVPTKPFPPMFPPGWGMPDTIVYAPLTRRIALAGSFERPSQTVMVDTPLVAEVNRWTALLAERFIYSPTQDFIWQDNARLRHASDFRSLVLERERPR